MANSIIMHVNCCEQGQTLEEICLKAVEFGFDGVEFRFKRFKSGHGESTTETPVEYLERIADVATKYGMEHVLFGGGPVLMNEPDPAARKIQTKEYCGFLTLATNYFDIPVCNLLSGTIFNDDSPR